MNQQKDIVFDGTMTWAPFVKQTLAMVRDHRHNYRRGPGYTVDESGHAIELCARGSCTGLLRYLIRRFACVELVWLLRPRAPGSGRPG